MNTIISSTIRKNLTQIFRCKLHTNIGLLQKKDDQGDKKDNKDDVQKCNPFCIESLEHKGHTVRKHNNSSRQQLYDFGVYVAACMPKYVQKVQLQHCDELEILVAAEGLFPVLSFMAYHQHACFNQCSTVTAIDVPSRDYRFQVSYMLLSLRFGERVRVITYTDELTPLHSAAGIWRNCSHHEREVYDLFGVVFTHHPDLRRILTDYGFDGHPLRKDFPLVGYIEVRYDDELKKMVYEPVEFMQEMRRYSLDCPWTYLRNFHEGYNAPSPKNQENKK